MQTKKITLFLFAGMLAVGCNRQMQISAPPANTSQPPASKIPLATAPAPFTIGTVSRHAQNFVNKNVRVEGYALAIKDGYAIFSDESTGPIGYYDLPVTGPGVNSLQTKQKYLLNGILIYKGLNASNNNPYHLELSNPPETLK